MVGWGLDTWGTSPWGGVDWTAYGFPPPPDPGLPSLSESREWPFLVGFEGRAWPESVDPFDLLATYGPEGLLYVAVLMSLFTDARAPESAPLPQGDDDRRGWWGDALTFTTMFPGDLRPTGSLLWLDERSKADPDAPARLRERCMEALAWMVKAGLASKTSVVAAAGNGGAVALRIVIVGPSGQGGISLNTPDFWSAYRAHHD